MNRLVILILVLAVAGVLMSERNVAKHEQPFKVEWEFSEVADLVIGVLPYRSDEEIQNDLGPLVRYLESNLKIPVKLNIAVDYRSLGRLLELDKVQLAWFSHSLFEQSPGREQWEILCRPKRTGSSGHRGAIVVKIGSPFQNLLELGGARFAYVDKMSGSGFILPARMLREQGMDPVASFSEVLFTGNHTRCVDAVIGGSADAAAIFSDAPLNATSAAMLPDGLRALAWTDWIPGDPVAVRKDMDEKLKARLRELMVNMHEFAQGKETLAQLKERRGFDSFEAEVVAGDQ